MRYFPSTSLCWSVTYNLPKIVKFVLTKCENIQEIWILLQGIGVMLVSVSCTCSSKSVMSSPLRAVKLEKVWLWICHPHTLHVWVLIHCWWEATWRGSEVLDVCGRFCVHTGLTQHIKRKNPALEAHLMPSSVSHRGWAEIWWCSLTCACAITETYVMNLEVNNVWFYLNGCWQQPPPLNK